MPGARPTTQYRETDWAFVQRLMAQEGWSWRLDHDANQHTWSSLMNWLSADVGALRFGRTDLRGANGQGEDKITRMERGPTSGPQCRDPGRVGRAPNQRRGRQCRRLDPTRQCAHPGRLPGPW